MDPPTPLSLIGSPVEPVLVESTLNSVAPASSLASGAQASSIDWLQLKKDSAGMDPTVDADDDLDEPFMDLETFMLHLDAPAPLMTSKHRELGPKESKRDATPEGDERETKAFEEYKRLEHLLWNDSDVSSFVYDPDLLTMTIYTSNPLDQRELPTSGHSGLNLIWVVGEDEDSDVDAEDVAS